MINQIVECSDHELCYFLMTMFKLSYGIQDMSFLNTKHGCFCSEYQILYFLIDVIIHFLVAEMILGGLITIGLGSNTQQLSFRYYFFGSTLKTLWFIFTDIRFLGLESFAGRLHWFLITLWFSAIVVFQPTNRSIFVQLLDLSLNLPDRSVYIWLQRLAWSPLLAALSLF